MALLFVAGLSQPTLRRNNLHNAKALGEAELQAALQEDVGEVVLSIRVVGFGEFLQRIQLLATRQVRHIGHHQVVPPIQQPRGIQEALGSDRQVPVVVLQFAGLPPQRGWALGGQSLP